MRSDLAIRDLNFSKVISSLFLRVFVFFVGDNSPMNLSAVILVGASLTCASGADLLTHKFERKQLTDEFWSEGANFGDFNKDGENDTETVLDVLGVELPCVVYYSTHKIEKTIVVAESAFRERFRENT